MAFGAFTVVRSTVKWVLGANGVLTSIPANTPAFEFNTDGTYRGLLVEPAGTNLLLRSETFSDAYWTKGRTTITPDTQTSPSGVVTADTLTDDTTLNATHRIFTENIAVTSGITYTSSVFARAGTSNRLEVRLQSSIEADIGIGATVFDLSSGTVVSGVGRITNYGNGWYRCENTGQANTTTNGRVFIYLYDSAGQRVYNGTATNTIFLWGAQLETGSVATSYIPTVASTVTRTADTVSLTGASSLIGQTEGTLYAEVQITAFGNAGVFFSISDGTTNNRAQIYKFTDSKIYSDRISATQSALTSISTSALTPGIYKVAFAYKTGDSALFINGVQVGSTATQTFTFGTIGKINIGARFDDTQIFNDRIRSVALFPSRLSNAQLATLTT